MNESTSLAISDDLDGIAGGRVLLDQIFDNQNRLKRDVSGEVAVGGKTSRARRRLPLLSVDKMLQQQRSLTAVERFSERHAEHELPTQAKYYRSLLPQSSPEVGQQYAFEVDLDRCTGCKACVSACHSLNGLDESELWRNVGVIHSPNDTHARVQTVTSSCHHCVEPACMNGCPVGAYEKDPTTGIVKHLDDQCFGCQYCTLMCPYDAPKFSQERGIVRKCDMCSQRLEVAEAPACVQACPNEAIRISVVDKSAVLARGNAGEFIGGAPDPRATKPTTHYTSLRKLPKAIDAIDRDQTRVEHTHWPLVIMLTLTQLGAGTTLFANLFGKGFGGNELSELATPAAALAWTAVALLASVFHLGRPHLAWRAVLNLRTSWLSREALAFGVVAQLMLLHVITLLPESIMLISGLAWIRNYSAAVGWSAALAGIGGVFCSVMVYVVTRREHWSWARTGLRFFGSLAVLGAASGTAVAACAATAPIDLGSTMTNGLGTVLLLGSLKLLWETSRLGEASGDSRSSPTMMARTMLEHLMPMVKARFLLGVTGILAIPLAILAGIVPQTLLPAATVVMLVTTLGGELVERAMFFCAAPGSRMPGALP